MFETNKIKWMFICDLRECGNLSMSRVDQALAVKGADRESVTHFYVTQNQLDGIVSPEEQATYAHDERGSIFSMIQFFGRTVRVMPGQMTACDVEGEKG